MLPLLLYLLGHILVESQTTLCRRRERGLDIRAVISGQPRWQTQSSVRDLHLFPISIVNFAISSPIYWDSLEIVARTLLKRSPTITINSEYQRLWYWLDQDISNNPPSSDCSILARKQKVLVPFCTFFGLFAPRLRDKPWCQEGTWKAAVFVTPLRLTPFCLVTDAQFGFPPPKRPLNWVH